ncbi:class I SAM-dependent methyltransferase [Rhodobacter maris]|uniref:Methyltransferase family protein n=1 Tax=Rhodobacter maris TaxID=446682 RepID=A0A285RMC4_9RHOB|nr:class I SAM-dependent methyltransferase [Rhodobacter maris]SOB94848.1 methyltransferase family protein [Rhodobacter maris]
MRATHAELVDREQRFPTGHRLGYPGYVAQMRKLRAEFERDFSVDPLSVDRVIAAFDAIPSEAFATPYALSPEALARVSQMVQRKYVMRFKNIRRSWAHLLEHMPELMVTGGPPRDVLEMSSAHGATLEVLRHFGHRAVGNDYANFLGWQDGVDSRFRTVNGEDLRGHESDPPLNACDGMITDWPYQPFIESQGLDVRLFDAGHLPYPFEDKSFDTVLCFDAIEHYCHPKDWMAIIDEFTRLARQSVLLIINPVQAHLLEEESYMAPYRLFQSQMRSYRANGFQCIHAGIKRNRLAVFKLMSLA